MAEDWLEHIVRQYQMTHVCRKDVALIAHLLKAGFTLIPVRNSAKVLEVDFRCQPDSSLPEALRRWLDRDD